MSERTPSTEEIRDQYTRKEPPFIGTLSSREAQFDRWLAKVKADAVREHEEKRVVIHMDPPQPRLVPVPALCPRCGWSR